MARDDLVEQLLSAQTRMLAELAELRATMAKVGAPHAPSKLISQLVSIYLDELQVEPKSKAVIVSTLAAGLRHFGDRPADDCSRADWLHWRDHVRAKETTLRKRAPEPYTLNVEIKRWRTVYRWGIVAGHCSTNPLLTIKPLRAKKHRHTRPQEDDLQRLLRYCSPMLAAFVIVAARTGMRSAEIRKLAWKEIDLPSRQITIPWNRTKTRKERRVPLTADAVAALQRIKPEVGGRWVLENPETREPYGKTAIWEWFRAAVDRAVLEAAEGDRRVVAHDLRHMFLSWASGVIPLPIAIAISGHSDLRTASRYIQVSDEQMRNARDELDKDVRKGPSRSEGKTENSRSEFPNGDAELLK